MALTHMRGAAVIASSSSGFARTSDRRCGHTVPRFSYRPTNSPERENMNLTSQLKVRDKPRTLNPPLEPSTFNNKQSLKHKNSTIYEKTITISPFALRIHADMG